jgi:hypothetical protein
MRDVKDRRYGGAKRGAGSRSIGVSEVLMACRIIYSDRCKSDYGSKVESVTDGAGVGDASDAQIIYLREIADLDSIPASELASVESADALRPIVTVDYLAERVARKGRAYAGRANGVALLVVGVVLATRRSY